MRLPGEEETRKKMRPSVCRKWLLAVSASVSVNSNKKLMSDFFCSLSFQSGRSNFKQWMFMFVSARLSKRQIPLLFCFT